ncbi:MAG: ester cyclase [Labilithrix sp.]|nr:ester cyclase [Labilithrix sp.]
MHKSIGLGFFVVFLAACGGDLPAPLPPQPEPPAPAPPAPVETAQPAPPAPKKALVELQQEAGRAMGEAFASADANKYAALFTDDAVLKFPGAPDAVGKDAIKRSMESFSKAFSKAKLGESRVFVKGEIVVSDWVMTATHSGDFMGAKASEKPVGIQGVSISWFSPEGLIKEEHVYYNPATVAFQIGASKEKNRAVATLPGKPDVVIAKGTPEEEANVQLFEKVNKAWEAKKDADLLALFSDDASWDDLMMPAPSKGKAEIKKYVTTFFKAFPDGKLTTTNVWGFGDWVVEEGTYAGTHKGNLMGMAPTNKSFKIHEVTIAKIGADKKIVSAATYGNDMELMAQLESKPAPKPAAPAPKK